MKTINLGMPVEAVALVLEGLGHLPYARVKVLFESIEAEAKRQLQPQPPAKKATDAGDQG